jgi:hypothetical protein
MQDDEAIDCLHFDEAAWLLISGELDDDARSAWQRHVAGCSECAGLLAARCRVLDVYDGLLSVPERALDLSRLSARTRRRPAWWQPAMVAAASLLLLIVGALAGRLILRSGGDGDALRDVQRRLDDVEVQLAVARIDQPTAAERLAATTAGAALVRRDPRIIESLLDALEADPSPNVRMAVVDALYDIERTARVQERFDALLAAQASPILRIALIELAADRRLVGTVGALKRVATERGEEAVRQRAEWAIGVLTRGA